MTRWGTWLFLIALTWYLAAMFRTLPLTLLLLCEIGLFVVMFALSRYLRHTLDAAFSSETAFGEKGRDCPCRICIRASGGLPAGRPRLTLALSYPGQRRKVVQRFYGGAEARRDTEVEFYVRPPYCGPLEIELRQVLTWDYLFLFPAKRRKAERMTLAVLPPRRALNFAAPPLPDAAASRTTPDVATPSDGASPETRDVREYRPGDAARAIHWKLSARTEKLWSREYEDEKQRLFTLRLDLSTNARMRPEDGDAFYEVASALILGLLRRADAVRVRWRDGSQDGCWDVTDERSRRTLFLRLYRSEPPSGTPEGVLTDFSLDTKLQWRRGADLIWRFDAADPVRDITERTFAV